MSLRSTLTDYFAGDGHRHKNLTIAIFKALVLVALFGSALNSFATSPTKVYTPAQLKSLTASFLADYYASNDKVEITLGNLDPRIGQRLCQTPLEFDARDPNDQGGNIHAQINCNDRNNWSLYIPAQVSIFREVPVAAQDLMRGHLLTLEDVHYQALNISNYRYKIITDINELVGKELKRNIGKNTVFAPASLDEPTLIRRNDLVQIISDAGGIVINVEGTALSDGRLSQSIRVRNNQSKRVVSGTVIAAGQVKVN